MKLSISRYNPEQDEKPYMQDYEIELVLQSPAERDKLNGAYECIMCGCCSSQCPSFWWNPDKFVGPAGLIQAYRFIVDSRDHATQQRLDNLNDAYRLFRCRTIMNCSEVCPKGLEPSHAIEEIRLKMSKVPVKGGGLEMHRPKSPK